MPLCQNVSQKANLHGGAIETSEINEGVVQRAINSGRREGIEVGTREGRALGREARATSPGILICRALFWPIGGVVPANQRGEQGRLGAADIDAANLSAVDP
jgi:hypothetical protein